MGERGTTRGRRTRLHRTAIVEAARDVLDAQGAEGFTMRAVAEAVGASPMALYRHVADRADLEMAVTRHVAGELTFEADDDADPDVAIAEWMRRVRAHWLRHPWFGHLIGQHPDLANVMAGVGKSLYRALDRAGAPPRLAAEELIRITRTTLGIVVIELASPIQPDRERRIPSPVGGLPPALADVLSDAFDDDHFFDLVVHTTLVSFRARLAESDRIQGDLHVHH